MHRTQHRKQRTVLSGSRERQDLHCRPVKGGTGTTVQEETPDNPPPRSRDTGG